MRYWILACSFALSTTAFGFDWPKEHCEKDFKTICPDKLPTKANINSCLDGHRDKVSPECLKQYDALKNLQGKKDDKKPGLKETLNTKKGAAKAKGDEIKKNVKDGDGSSLKDPKKQFNDLLK